MISHGALKGVNFLPPGTLAPVIMQPLLPTFTRFLGTGMNAGSDPFEIGAHFCLTGGQSYHINTCTYDNTYLNTKEESMSNQVQVELETCLTGCIHQNVVESVKAKMPHPETLFRLADLFKLFGDSTRASILWALSESEMCVCDLSALLQMKQPAVSHQLRNLKQARIVKNRREGKVVYYSLDDDHIKQLLNLGMDHLVEP